jgi:predicted dehydrogenase
VTARAARSAPLRLVQVGMGGWGRDWMGVTGASPDVEPVAFVDPSPDARAATAARGAPVEALFADLPAALAATRPDAALVTTAVAGHVPVAVAALGAGLPVLLEKPFAGSLADAVDAVRAADRADRTLMISQNYRYYPAPRAATALLAAGRVGDVVSVEVDFRRHRLRRPADAVARHQAMDHPLLVDMSIHHFDLLRLVLGREARWIEVDPITPPGSAYRDPPAAVGLIGFDGGIAVSYRGSWVSSGRRTPWGGEWRIEGTGGSLEFATRGDVGFVDRLRVRTPAGAARPVPLVRVPHEDRAGALAAFVRAICDGEEPETSGRHNLATLALTLAAVRSATERRRIDLADVLADLPEDLR